MLLEESVRGPAAAAAPVVTRLPDGLLELDTRPLILDAFEPGDAAARFHAGLAALIVSGATIAAADADLDRVVLGGGVFANDVLTSAVAAEVDEGGPAGVPSKAGAGRRRRDRARSGAGRQREGANVDVPRGPRQGDRDVR